ncbi:hypothetical protein [Staphylococcus sp.]|uniref:hypothetical protein n=1 Tax=Staphylococcus sp. TaxID=29387 RepID=UPI002909989D|nr:hypothetical protein [Staphylococcus sp.]MDU3541131.1 hypothetical protein [Staphylococcus sp.]MDU4837015.1 hypothetical protein [Staphylococcus sp.]
MEKEINNNKTIIIILATFNLIFIILSYLAVMRLLFLNNPELNSIAIVIIGFLFGSAYKELWKAAIGAKIQKLEKLYGSDEKPFLRIANMIKSVITSLINYFQVVLLTYYVAVSLEKISDKINSQIFWFIIIILIISNIICLLNILSGLEYKE